MPDYAPNYTARYRMRYRVNGLVHTAQIRIGRDEPNPATVGAALFTDLLNAWSPRLQSDFTVLGADVAGTDSDVFLPASVLPVAGALSATVGDQSTRPLYVSFVGRSVSGQRAALFLYGFISPPTGGENTANDYRIMSTEDAAVEDAVAALNLAAANGVVANDNVVVAWYPYVNVGFNAYYQRKTRRG